MVEITTLGSFVVSVNGKSLSDDSKRATKLWQLLNLFIINRDKPLPINVIYESIWQGEDSIVSNKSLHNLIYRLRHLLSHDGTSNCVVFKNNCYMLNIEDGLTVDVHLMEDYFNDASDPRLPIEAKTELLQKALDLYNGEYALGAVANDIWSLSAVSRYKRIFSDTVCMLADIHYNAGEYDKMIQVCNKGILFEPLDELFYQRLIMGMKCKGQILQAIALCDSYFSMIYHEFGVRASDTLNDLYKQLKSNNTHLLRGVDEAISELDESRLLNSALYCGFDVFKEIYRYETRKNARLENAIFILLMSMSSINGEVIASNMQDDAKRCLHKCCMYALRKGDVISDYSPTQVIIMLTNAGERDIPKIISRIEKYFKEDNISRSVRLKVETKGTSL